MKRICMLVLLVGAVLTLSTVVPQKTSGQKSGVQRAQSPIPNRYIVLLDEETLGRDAVGPQVEAQGQYLSNSYGGTIKDVFSSAVKGMVMEMTPKQAAIMNLDPSVRSIEEDGVISVSSTETGAPWHLDRLDQRSLPLTTTYDYNSVGAGVHVYVLDTGIRVTHNDFGGRANVVYDNIGDGQNGNDCHGHGTHVAGVVGGGTYGVAKGVSLHAVRVLPCSGNGQISDLLMGVDWVTAHHQNPAVANISITAAGMSTALEAGISNSIASGVTYTIAAGNSGLDACSFTPARTPSALTVGASSDTDVRPGYSNQGACIDLFAPGHMVTSASFINDTDSRVLSGTSQASPAVAGAAALYLGANPSASPAAVAAAIKSSATTGKITNIDGTSANLLLYSLLTGSPTPTPTPTATPTPTPTVTPTPTPTPGPANAKVRVKKQLQNGTGTSSNVEFPYVATNLSTPSFALVDNSIYEESNVAVQSGQTVITVTEAPVTGWRLVSIACTEASTGEPTVVNTTTDLANHRANIVAEPGEDVSCTFLSEPMAPTAANVSIGGRVTVQDGNGIRGLVVRLQNVTRGTSVQTTTNNFGYYQLDELPVGDSYILTVVDTKKRYTARNGTRVFTLTDELTGFDFVVDPTIRR